MSKNLEKQKQIEKFYNEKFFRTIYNIAPKYIDIKLDRPDFYFEVNNQNFAVELTTYFMQDDEKKNVILKRDVSKYLESENWLYEAYKHFGKKENEKVTVHYKNKKDIIDDIIKAKKYIKYIQVDDDFWYYSKEKDIGNCILINSNKERISIEDFLNFINFINTDKTDITIGLLTKNKYCFTITLKHHIYTLNKKEKCVDYLYVWWENEENKYESIKKAILKKINKYDEYKKELFNKNIIPNKYILIIYPEQFPLDIDNYDDLYSYLKTDIMDFKYSEIGILLFNKILVLTNTEYKIYKS